MSSEEYWHGAPELAAAYRKKAELETEYHNQLAWWQGLYIYEALSVIKAQAFAKDDREAKKYSYTSEPYRIKPYTEEELEQKKKEDAQKASDRAIAELTNWKAAWDQKNGRNNH